MLNKVILQGNVGRVPKIKLTQDGREIASFFLATNTLWKEPDGKWQICTEWHRITVFRESTVKWIKEALKKGDSLYIEGKLTYHNWTDIYGQPRSTPHVTITPKDGRVHFLHSSNREQAETSPVTNESQPLEPIQTPDPIQKLVGQEPVLKNREKQTSGSPNKDVLSIQPLSSESIPKSLFPRLVKDNPQTPDSRNSQHQENN